MKRWWSSIVADYFTFTKRERTGIFVLLMICLIAYLAPRFNQSKKPAISKDAFARELAQLSITVDSSQPNNRYASNDDDHDYYRPKSYDFDKAPKGELFTFDPNTLDANGWKRLGIRDRTISTIQKFVSKGYKFRHPEDIKKIYGLHANEAERLIPYIRIAAQNVATAPAPIYASHPVAISTKRTYTPRIIDVNDADTTAFISLPGIGSKLAMRIVNFRDKLGGFTSVNQVAETYGIPDSTFQKIKPSLQCNPDNIKTFSLNQVSADELKNHPYIRWNLANAIVNYRKQHGNFTSVTDLKKIEIISDEIYEKIAPYVRL